MRTITGLRRANKPGQGALWAPLVSVKMTDPSENAAAVEAVRRTAGDWLSELAGRTPGLRKPRGSPLGWPALGETFQGLQRRCHQAAIDAVLRLRDPGYESPDEIRDREAAEDQALKARRQRVVTWVWRASGADLDAAERLTL